MSTSELIVPDFITLDDHLGFIKAVGHEMTQYFGRSNFSFRSVYPLGGLDWELCLSNPDHHFQLFVGCGTSRQGVTWSCKAKIIFTLKSEKVGVEDLVKIAEHHFTPEDSELVFFEVFQWEDFLVDKNFLKDDKATFIVAIEIENISIKSTQGIDQLKEFTSKIDSF